MWGSRGGNGVRTRAGTIRLSSDTNYNTYRDTCNVIRYISRYIDTDTAALRSIKNCTFFYSICKPFNKTNIFVTPFGKLTINLTFILYTELTCLCLLKHVIHTIKTSKHEESTVLIDRSQQILCTIKVIPIL